MWERHCSAKDVLPQPFVMLQHEMFQCHIQCPATDDTLLLSFLC